MASIMNRVFGITQHSSNGFEVVTDAAYHSVKNRKGGEGREEEGKGKEFFFAAYLLRDTWRAKHAFSKILIFHFKLKPNINIGEIGSSQNWWEFIDFNKMNAWLDLISTYLQGKGSIDQLTLGHCLKITIVWNSLITKKHVHAIFCSLWENSTLYYFVGCKGILENFPGFEKWLNIRCVKQICFNM